MTNDDFLVNMFNQVEEPVTPTVENVDDSVDPQDPQVELDQIQDTNPVVEEDDSNPELQVYLDFLQQNNLIDIPEDEELKGPQDLQKIFEYTKENRKKQATEELFQSLPESFKPVLEYALNGGSDVIEFLNNYGVNPLDKLDLESEDGQRKAIFLELKETTNYSDEKINKIVSRLAEDPDELAVEAVNSYRELTRMREEKMQDTIKSVEAEKEKQRKLAEQKTQALFTAIDNASTIHPQRRNKVKAFFFEPINTESGVTTGFNHTINNILNNPEHQAQLADILLEYDPNAGFSLDRLERKVQTKAAQKFQNSLAKALKDAKELQSSSNRSPQKQQDLDWRTL